MGIMIILIFAVILWFVGVVVLYWGKWRERTRLSMIGKCQKCGYDLTGNETGKCSECGWGCIRLNR